MHFMLCIAALIAYYLAMRHIVRRTSTAYVKRPSNFGLYMAATIGPFVPALPLLTFGRYVCLIAIGLGYGYKAYIYPLRSSLQ